MHITKPLVAVALGLAVALGGGVAANAATPAAPASVVKIAKAPATLTVTKVTSPGVAAKDGFVKVKIVVKDVPGTPIYVSAGGAGIYTAGQGVTDAAGKATITVKLSPKVYSSGILALFDQQGRTFQISAQTAYGPVAAPAATYVAQLGK